MWVHVKELQRGISGQVLSTGSRHPCSLSGGVGRRRHIPEHDPNGPGHIYNGPGHVHNGPDTSLTARTRPLTVPDTSITAPDTSITARTRP